MQQAAIKCDKSASMLSKSLKRLENTLKVKLFDRVGKHIQLNAVGEKFRKNATKLVAQAKQSMAECANSVESYTIAAPAILLCRWASVVTKTLHQYQANSLLTFNSVYEQQALNQLKQGSADIAIVTSAVKSQLTKDMFYAPLGKITMQVAAAKNHPLVKNQTSNDMHINTQTLLSYDFVSTSMSPYCGEMRSIGCDGWQNEVLPRKVTIIANDLSVLGHIVRSGQALAYLPDYLLREFDLKRLIITDCDYYCHEQLFIVSLQQNLIGLFTLDE